MVFEKFLPPQFVKAKLDLLKLTELTGKNWLYGATGSICLFHILKSFNCKGKILLPVFTCPRILIPVHKLGLEPIFYDLNINDLNPSLESIEILSERYKVKTVLSVSLFGNPADMINIEEYCKQKDILLIDDNAQSFGGRINGRWLGTFGNAGFFAFSPGKATAGHMGGFFWSDKPYEIKYRKHTTIHWLKWLDFNLNRVKIYDQKKLMLKKIINVLASKSVEYWDLTYDSLAEFEKGIIGGILEGIFNGEFNFRNNYHNQFINAFSNNPYFKPVKALRGEPNNHKLVLIANSGEIADKLISYLKNKKIFCSNSYVPLCKDINGLVGMKTVSGKVIELPIEDNSEKMNYLFDKLNSFTHSQ